MLSFHPLSLEDKCWVDQLTFLENSRSADYNFGNMFLWDRKYHQYVSQSQHHLVVLCNSDDPPFFPFPIGSQDLQEIIPKMKQYAEANSFPFILRGLEEEHIERLEHAFPNCFSFCEDRDYADYLYSVDKLISLEGKKYHGKRNHISHFTATNTWSFRPLIEDDFAKCRKLIERWEASKNELASDTIDEEHALERAFQYYKELGLMGGCLFIDGELVAFSIGERISKDTFDVHFEKARAEIDGTYPMINREFARLIHRTFPEIRYINREDDMGQENLRKSKLSYYPEILLMKHSAYWEPRL